MKPSKLCSAAYVLAVAALLGGCISETKPYRPNYLDNRYQTRSMEKPAAYAYKELRGRKTARQLAPERVEKKLIKTKRMTPKQTTLVGTAPEKLELERWKPVTSGQ